MARKVIQGNEIPPQIFEKKEMIIMTWKTEIKKKGPLGAGKYFGGNEMPNLMELDAIVKDKLDEETYKELKDFINELLFAYEKKYPRIREE